VSGWLDVPDRTGRAVPNAPKKWNADRGREVACGREHLSLGTISTVLAEWAN